MSFFDDASLAFLPSGAAGKDGKAYSIKPTDGTGDFTFSRGSNLAATRVGADGLIEKGRENLLTQSNRFDLWDLENVTSGHAGYDGTNDAYLQSGLSRVQRNISESSGVYTASVYVKAGFSNYVQFRIGSSSTILTRFELIGDGTNLKDTGTFHTSIEPVSGATGWYRISISFNSDATQFRIQPENDSSGTKTADSSVYIQDAQLEIGLAATEVIESGATKGKAGLLENEPRFDYSGGVTCPSLLLEPSRTNLLEYSEYFEGSGWTTQAGITLTANTTETLSPEGLNNAYKVVSTDATKGFYFSGLSVTTAVVRTIYLKGSVGGETIVFKDPSGFGTPSTKTLTTDWQRFEMATTNDGNTYQGLFIDDISVGTIYAYGAQLEQGSYPTSYIPNHSGGTITRGADDCQDAGDTASINSTEGVLYVEASALADDGTSRMIALSDASSNNHIRIYPTTTSNRITIAIKSGNVNQYVYHYDGLSDITETWKVAVKYKANDFATFVNGTKVNSSTSGSAPVGLNELQYNGGNSANPFYGNVKQTLVFDTALSDADLATLTTL